MSNYLSSKMKKVLAYALTGAMTAGVVAMGPVNKAARVEAAEGDVEIDETNFPDEDFRKKVSEKAIDSNEDGFLSQEERLNVKSLWLNGPYGGTYSDEHPGCAMCGITNLTGIEHFPALESLTIPGILAKSIDLSKNTELKTLRLSNRYGLEYTKIKLESLDLSNNTKLTTLDIHHAPDLKNLNISENTNLESIYLTELPVKELDFSNNTNLKSILVEDSANLTNVNINKNTALQGISIYRADNLTKLDISKNENLTGVTLWSTGVSSLDVSKNSKLTSVCLSNSKNITDINVSNLKDLGYLYLDGTSVSSIDISKNEKLFWLRINSSNISEINISNNPYLIKSYKYGVYNDYGDWGFYDIEDESIQEKGCRLFCDKGLKVICDPDEGKSDASGDDKKDDKKDTTPKYSEEWVDGKWYNKDGTQTYKGTMQWKSNATGWWIEDSTGWYPANAWQKIDGTWYFFKPDGYMASNEYYNGYWFNKDGSWGEQYFLSWKQNSTGWWVEDKSGWWPESSWLKIDGCWYYFDASGYMVTNQYIDGWWIGADGVCY